MAANYIPTLNSQNSCQALLGKNRISEDIRVILFLLHVNVHILVHILRSIFLVHIILSLIVLKISLATKNNSVTVCKSIGYGWPDHY